MIKISQEFKINTKKYALAKNDKEFKEQRISIMDHVEKVKEKSQITDVLKIINQKKHASWESNLRSSSTTP